MVAAERRWLFQQWHGAGCKQKAIKSHVCTGEQNGKKWPVFGDTVGKGEILSECVSPLSSVLALVEVFLCSVLSSAMTFLPGSLFELFWGAGF